MHAQNRVVLAESRLDYPVILTQEPDGRYCCTYGKQVDYFGFGQFSGAFEQFVSCCRHAAECAGLVDEIDEYLD